MNAIVEVFAPGEFLREELEARGWSQTEFAEIIGRPVRLINEVIAGKKIITPETAIQFGQSLGTGPEVWLNLESQYQLSKVQAADDLIQRRARLHSIFPVREMTKRGWISSSKNVDVLQQQLLAFFRCASLDDPKGFCHAARKSEPDTELTMLQLAWLLRAESVAKEMITSAPYSDSVLRETLTALSALRTAPEETRHVARLLDHSGVRFVVVEPIVGSKIDGACFWLDKNQPVVAMTLRLDRIDNFWFVLRHELEHVLLGHGQAEGYVLDQDISTVSSEQLSEEERIANEAGASFCVDQVELAGFTARVGPYYKEERVLRFAQRLGIHPGLVAGQLQRRLGRFDLFRKYQVKVRQFVTSTARTDGWGVVETQ